MLNFSYSSLYLSNRAQCLGPSRRCLIPQGFLSPPNASSSLLNEPDKQGLAHVVGTSKRRITLTSRSHRVFRIDPGRQVCLLLSDSTRGQAKDAQAERALHAKEDVQRCTRVINHDTQRTIRSGEKRRPLPRCAHCLPAC